ncbi:MAG TPA: hypothetical protein VGV59_05385 [Pyrinomonadaceae bacterium]|nr:hypothetical protein [Pyrinomonadaceae bacterium]
MSQRFFHLFVCPTCGYAYQGESEHAAIICCNGYCLYKATYYDLPGLPQPIPQTQATLPQQHDYSRPPLYTFPTPTTHSPHYNPQSYYPSGVVSQEVFHNSPPQRGTCEHAVEAKPVQMAVNNNNNNNNNNNATVSNSNNSEPDMDALFAAFMQDVNTPSSQAVSTPSAQRDWFDLPSDNVLVKMLESPPNFSYSNETFKFQIPEKLQQHFDLIWQLAKDKTVEYGDTLVRNNEGKYSWVKIIKGEEGELTHDYSVAQGERAVLAVHTHNYDPKYQVQSEGRSFSIADLLCLVGAPPAVTIALAGSKIYAAVRTKEFNDLQGGNRKDLKGRMSRTYDSTGQKNTYATTKAAADFAVQKATEKTCTEFKLLYYERTPNNFMVRHNI